MRIGQGFDAHRLVPGRTLVLGGVTIAWEKGLLGHSDADVLTHAVMDALLGGAGLGDIGQHFPDTDPAFKDVCSTVLLSETGRRVAAAGYTIENIDATLIAQSPRLSPYRETMRTCMADALGLCSERINLKFSTEEGMGYTGREEGMSAHAVCLLV